MKRIILETDNSNKQFLYEQLYETIKEDILSGSIKAGEKLPSLRSLSNDLGISLTTIGQAYQQLLVEGYIQSKPQSGFFAAQINSVTSAEAQESVEEIRIAAKYDVKFVISSDAHVPENVGLYEPQLLRALDAGLDPERIVNIRAR